jgi:hypothetical protein
VTDPAATATDSDPPTEDTRVSAPARPSVGNLAAVPRRLRSEPVLGSLLGHGDATVAVP